MSRLPTEIFSVQSVREIDVAAIAHGPQDGYQLMTRAATAALHHIEERYPHAMRFCVICGAGNNAGDGYVLARLARKQGNNVAVLSLVAPGALHGDAARARDDYVNAGGEIDRFDDRSFAGCDLIVDALLGSGLQRDVEGQFAAAVNACNEHDVPIVSLDIPSGIGGDSGCIRGIAMQADMTVTFVGLKSGLFLDAGPEHTGALCFDDLGIDEKFRQQHKPVLRLLGDVLIKESLPARKHASHKGSFGHVLVVGGAPGMSGAIRLCAEAALRSGAGLVSVATHLEHSSAITQARPELMCHGVASGNELKDLLERATVVALGPGLGCDSWGRDLFSTVLDAVDDQCPLVVDADGLNLLAEAPSLRDNRVLTPHPGEAATLLATTSKAIQADRPAALTAMQEKFAGTIVLKGANTLVSAGDGVPWVCRAGNPGMASGGMGDVLTGVVSAMLAQGLNCENAAAVAVEVHARAGDTAALDGRRGPIASDLIAALRWQVNPQ